MFGQDPNEDQTNEPEDTPPLDGDAELPGTTDDEDQQGDENDENPDELEDAPGDEPAPPPEDDLQPVTVRAGGQQFEVPGAVMAPEGMYVPKEAVDQVLSLIQRGRHHEMTFPAEQQRWKAETQRLEALRDVEKAEAAAWTAEMQRVFGSEDTFLQFVENLAHNLESVKARVASAKMAKENEMLRKGIHLDRPATELHGDDFVRAASQSLLDNYDQMVEDPALVSLLPSKDDRDAVWSQIAQQANIYITKAQEDVPELQIVKGETVIDLQRMYRDVKRFAEFLGRGRAPAKAGRAAQINAAVRNAQPNRTARPPQPARSAAARSMETKPVDNYETWRAKMLAHANSEG